LNNAPVSAARLRPGRPLNVDVGRAILRAAAAILAETGYGGLSIERVAQQAGVTRQTIYRRWATKIEIVAAILETLNNDDAPVPDSGDLRSDLRVLGRRYAIQQTPGAPFLHSLVVEAQYNPALATVVDAYIAGRRDQVLTVIRRAASRGDLRADADPAIVTDLFYGFAWYRRLVARTTISEDDDVRVIDSLLAGVLAEQPSP
jgi:AcrR family transcriptional regulator